MKRAYTHGNESQFNKAIEGMKNVPGTGIYIDNKGTKTVELYYDNHGIYTWMERFVNPGKCITNSGYRSIAVRGGVELVHRLVAKAWVPNPENKPTVNHKDYDKLNNDYTNLEWMTMEEQTQDAVAHGRIKNKRHINYGYYVRAKEVLILPDGTKLHLTPTEYVMWRIDRKLPVRGWMQEYVRPAKYVLANGYDQF